MKIHSFILLFLCISIVPKLLWSKNISILEGVEMSVIEDSIEKTLNEANYQKSIGDFKQAQLLIEKLHLMRKSILPDTSQLIIKSFINMANVNTLVYEYDKALQYLNEAESICKRSAGERSEEIGIIYSYYGRIYKDMGNYIQAEQFLKIAEKYLKKDGRGGN